MGKHRSLREKIAVVVDVQDSGLVGKRRDDYLRRRHKVGVSTYYKWQKEVADAQEKPAKQGFLAQFSTGEPEAWDDDPSQREGYLEMMAGEEQQIGRQQALRLELEKAKVKARQQQKPTVRQKVRLRHGHYSVRVHGERLSRQVGSVKMNVALPAELYQRLLRGVQGSLAQAIPALLRHALDSLDFDEHMLEVYDERQPKPESLPAGPLMKGALSPERRQMLKEILMR